MQNVFAKINEFFENQKEKIYCAATLILIVDVLFAAFFLPQYLHTRQFRNYMVFGSPVQTATFPQFLKYGWSWLAFADVFLFLPAILVSMLLPQMLKMAQAAQGEE